MTRRTIYTSEAAADLEGLYNFIADQAGAGRALDYVTRLDAYCRSFAVFPERGERRDDLLAGLRVVGFEHRISIAFHIEPDRVVFDRVFYGGRQIESAWFDEP